LSIVTNPAHGNASFPICELSLINIHPRPEKATFPDRESSVRNQKFSYGSILYRCSMLVNHRLWRRALRGNVPPPRECSCIWV